MKDCPPRHALQQLLSGELPGTLEPNITAHLETCAICQETLEQMTAVVDGFPKSDCGSSTQDATRRSKSEMEQSTNHTPSSAVGRLSDTQLLGLRGLLPPDSGAAAAGISEQTSWPSVPGYEILGQLGQGGMAIVYKARHLRLNRLVALKMIRAGAHAGPEQMVRFCAEGEIIAHLRHPNIVQIYEVSSHDRQLYFALELMEGGSLDKVQGGKPMAPRAAAELVETLARAMEHAHQQGVIHRDLKPANILLSFSRRSRSGVNDDADSAPLPERRLNDAAPKIADFGLAKHVDTDSRLTKTGHVIGTPNYMAPEQVHGRVDQIGPVTDLYSLGAILYELLTGRPPFSAPTSLEVMNQVAELEPVPPSRLLPNVPRDLEVICLKCLEKEPARRYAAAEALADDLRRFLNGEPIRARRVATMERAWRWARRKPAVAALAVVVALVAVVGFPGATLLWLIAADARQKAEQSEGEAGRQRNRAQQQSADLLLQRGLELAHQGEAAKGLHWMLEALRTAPTDADAFRRVVRINLDAWLPQTCELRCQHEHPDEVTALTIHPDGKTVLTGCVLRPLYRWNAFTGQPVGEPIELPGEIQSVTYSPDGKTILAGGGAHHSDKGELKCWVRQWDAVTGEPRGPTLVHELRVWSLAYSPDGKTFLVGAGSTNGRKGEVRLWDAGTGQPLRPPLTLPFAVAAVAFSPDGGQFVTATGALHANVPGEAQLWDTTEMKPIGEVFRHANGVSAVCFSPDGKLLLTGGRDRAVRRWDLPSGRLIGEPLWHPRSVSALTISPDGATILTRADDGVIRFWEIATGRLLDARAYHDGGHANLVLSADGQTLLTGARGDRSARVWNVGRARPRPVSSSVEDSRTPNQPFYYCLAYNLEHDRVLTGGRDGLAQLWEASTGRPVLTVEHPHPHVRAVAFSPDGRRIATACMEGRTVTCKARIWDAATGRPLTPWMPHRNHVVALAFSPDGKLLATGDYSHDLHLWDTATGERVGDPLRQRDIVLSLAFSPDGKRLVAGTAHDWNRDPQARLWDVTRRQTIGEPLRHTGYVVYLAFSPDGKTVVTGSQDSTFRLWDAATGHPRSDYRTVSKGWRCAAVGPAGMEGEATLATAGGDGLVRLWSLIDGSPIEGATMPHPREAQAVAVAFSPDGTLLVVGHEDGTAQLWDLATRMPLGPPVLQYGKLLGVAFSPDGQKFLTTAADGATRVWPTPTYGRQVEHMTASDPSDFEKLSLWLQVRTGLRMDEGQALSRITVDEWRLRHEQLAAGGHTFGILPSSEIRESSDRSLSPSATFSWHDDRARDAEQTEQTFTARWHLDRLIGLQPTDWLLYARRARTHTNDGRWDQAEKDYQRALELGFRDDLLAWYHSRVRACQWRQQPSTAQRYLHRIFQLGKPPVGLIPL